jgi:hypothetical protein
VQTKPSRRRRNGDGQNVNQGIDPAGPVHGAWLFNRFGMCREIQDPRKAKTSLGHDRFDMGNRRLFRRAHEILIRGAVCMDCQHAESIADIDAHFNFNS